MATDTSQQPTTDQTDPHPMWASVVWALFMTAAHGVAFATCFVAVFAVQVFQKFLFEPFGTDLPVLTLYCVRASNLVTWYWYLFLLLLIPDFLMLLGMNRLPRHAKWLSHLLGAVCLLLTSVLIALALIGCALPWVKGTTGLTS